MKGRMKKILLVEDTPIIAEEIADILEMENYRVSIVHNGRDAIEYLKTSTPDLIITDLLMPEVDGFTLIKGIRENPSLKKVPIIVLSAKTDEEAMKRVAKLGASSFIKKPCKPSILMESISTVLPS
jgi:DNA-binding response OmpR family regulator